MIGAAIQLGSVALGGAFVQYGWTVGRVRLALAVAVIAVLAFNYGFTYLS